MTMVIISRESHARKRIIPVTSFAFARNLIVVRIIASEAAPIAQNFPIAFINENDGVAPVAVLGLSENENLFVSEQGQWLGSYIPAYLRRYPFYMGKSSGSGADNLTVLIDDAYLSDTDGEPLFGPEEGELKGPLARAIQLLTEIAIQDFRTREMTKTFAESDLFKRFPFQVTRGTSPPANLTGLQILNEAKLNALGDDKFLELRRKGALPLAYAHLLSLGQLGRLRALAAKTDNRPV